MSMRRLKVVAYMQRACDYDLGLDEPIISTPDLSELFV